jgi:uncharacterized protein
VGQFRVDTTEDAAEALAHAESFLFRRPVEHNLVLSILNQRLAHFEPGRYWVVRNHGEVNGFALRSPLTFAATVTPMAAPAIAALVDTVVADAPDLPGISGEAGTVAAFAGYWAERARVCAQPLEAQRLYKLDGAPNARPAPGSLRLARVADADVLVEWSKDFQAEIGLPHPGDIAEVTRRRILGARLWVWEDQDDQPVSAAGATGAVAGVTRVNFVYTPPEHRRQGYASACVSALSAHLRVAEANTCVLYAQLTNPTSNGVYCSIGYRPVIEVLLYRFGRRGLRLDEQAPAGGR